MTRKEIQKVIIDNPSKQLYIRHSSGIIDFHERVSKTRVLENSKYIFFALARMERNDQIWFVFHIHLTQEN